MMVAVSGVLLWRNRRGPGGVQVSKENLINAPEIQARYEKSSTPYLGQNHSMRSLQFAGPPVELPVRYETAYR
jgi:hypothetical protein